MATLTTTEYDRRDVVISRDEEYVHDVFARNSYVEQVAVCQGGNGTLDVSEQRLLSMRKTTIAFPDGRAIVVTLDWS